MSEPIKPALSKEEWRKRPRRPADERFEEKVERVTEGGCWVWLGNLDRKGYGRFHDTERHRGVLAHRWAYKRFRGPITAPTLDHLCRNPSCVNPWHMEPVSHFENIHRSPIAVASKHARKQRCPRGHEYVTITEAGRLRRRCPECQRVAVRDCMRRRRANGRG